MKRKCRPVIFTIVWTLIGCSFVSIITQSFRQCKTCYPSTKNLNLETKVGTFQTPSASPTVRAMSNEKVTSKVASTRVPEIATAVSKVSHYLQNVPFTLVTGADSFYFGGLANLVGSIHFWEPKRNIVVYDFGLEQKQISKIKTWCKTKLVTFDFKNKPEHVSNLLLYAWKPLVIKEAVDRFGKIFWLDAGCDVRGPLNKVDEYLRQDGHFFVQGQDTDMTGFVHHKMFDYFQQPRTQFKGKYSFAGGISGWVKDSHAYTTVLPRWTSCALDVACIAPKGSSMGNHRFDQAALSILMYSSGIKVTAHTELLAAERRQLKSNQHDPSTYVIYTARGRSSDYKADLCRNTSVFIPTTTGLWSTI
ncbi:uncharacterized protein LOC106179275 isoform X2 [Lingula anatina]|nr:uncharacterized protein LOC106179275 isoform X2 [Lingula anatina]|eukprot:XP_013418275.1 uncharacterized protein LOC106179275 isoform X2 [Lingula anatina]